MFYGSAKCYYSSAKYTPEELKNAERLCAGLSVTSMGTFDIEKGSLSEDEYQAKVHNFLATCKLPSGIVWENLRKQGLAKLDYEMKVENLMQEAVNDPSVLKTSEFSEYCTEYIDALNGTDDELMAAWKKLYINMAKENSDPDRIMKEYRTKANDANWRKLAKESLFFIGWNNCMCALAYEGKFYVLVRDEAQQAFRKLFIRIVEEEI